MDKNKKEKIKYISLFEAAKKSGYAQDYLSLLCRQGKLKGEKIGRNWVTTYQWLDEYQQNLISDIVSEKKHITHKKDFKKKERKIKIPELVLATSLFFLILLGGFTYAKNPQFFSNIQDIKKQATIRIVAFKSDLAEQAYQTKDQIAYRLSEIGENVFSVIASGIPSINLEGMERGNLVIRSGLSRAKQGISSFYGIATSLPSVVPRNDNSEGVINAGKSIVMFPLKVGEKFGEGIITYPIKIPIKIGDSFDKGFAKNDLVLNSSLRKTHLAIQDSFGDLSNGIAALLPSARNDNLSKSEGEQTLVRLQDSLNNSFNNLSKGASVFFETTDRKTDREKEFGRVAGVSDSIEENTEVKLLQNLRKVSFHNISKSISKVEKFIWETPIRVADESANIVIDGPIKIGETVIAAADKTINQISDAYISAGKSLANGVNPIRNISRDYVSYYSAGISNGVNNFSDKIIGFSNKVAGFFNSGLNNVSKKLANLFGNTYFGLTQLFVEQGGEKISQVQIQIQEGDDTDRRLQNETGTEDEIENLKEGLDILQQEIDELKKVSTGKIIQQNITQEIVREIIKEQKGEQGLAGPQGPAGAAGLQGPVGAGTTIVQGGDAYLSGGNTWIGGNVFEGHTLMNSLGVSHKISIGDDLSVGGTITLGTTAVDDLNVYATSNFYSPLNVTNDITQSSGQVTFGGNVDATSGLDITGADLTVGGTNFAVDVATGDIITSGDLTIAGTTTLGDASTDTIIPNAQFTGDLIPSTTSVYDLGSATNYWDSAYINNIVVGSTNVGGTTSESFILNTDNATADAEDIWMEFERGAAVPNAKILWSSGNTRFDFNFPVHLSGTGALSGPGAGGLTLTNDSGPLTVSTTTSGDLALTSADDLTLSSGGATSINSTGALTLDSATGILTLGAGTNTIINTDTNTAILINPNGTGAVQFHSAANYLDSSGNLILDGDITLTSGGTFYSTANNDLVFAPNGSGNLVIGETANPAKIIPFADSTVGYDLGEATQRWYDLYLKNSIDIDSTKLDINSLDFVALGQITTGASTDLTLQPGAGGKTRITDGTDYVHIADGTRALYAVKGSQAVELADGTWAIDATGDINLSGDITIAGGKAIFGAGAETIDNETSNLLKLTTSGDTKVVLGDSAGAKQFQIADSDDNVVYYVDSNGNVSSTSLTASSYVETPQIQTGSGDLTLAPAGKTTTAKNFETTGSGTITSAGLLTAQDGLTVSGSGNILFSTSGTINQSGSGQITFSGNVDATNGLDITGVTNLGDGGTANYAQFSATGDLTLVGTADTIQKSDGALIIQTTGQNLTVQTTSSGNLALTSADDLTLTAGTGILTLGAGTNTIVNTDAATDLLINPTGKVQFQTSDYWVDGSGNLQVAKVISPELEYAGDITIDATNDSATSTVSITNSDGSNVANLEIEGDVKIIGGNLGIGMDPNANAIAISGDGTIDLYSAASPTTLTITNSDGTQTVSLDIADGGLKTSGQSRLTSAGALENITGYTQGSGSFDMSGSAETFQTGTGAVSLKGDATIDSGKTLTGATSGQTATSDAVSFGIDETGETGSAYDTLVLSRVNGAGNSYALYVSSGDVLLAGDTYFGTTNYGVTSAGVGTFAGITGTSLDAGSGTIQTTGTADFGATTVTSLDVSSGGITNAGAITGATTIDASGIITGGTLTDGSFSVISGNITGAGNLTFSGSPVITINDGGTMTWKDNDTPNTLMTLTDVGSVGDLNISGDATVSGGELYLTGTASSSSTTEGTMYYDTDDDQLKVYANGKWQADRTTATVIVGVNTGVAATSSKNYEKADYVCDGTDDHLEIESAIAALPDNGGLVHLLEGTYNINASIDITKSNVTLMGSGDATKLFLVNNADVDVIVVGDGSGSYSNINIFNFKIDGNRGNNATYKKGIYFNSNITKSRIENTYIYNAGESIYLNGNSNENIIANNIIEGNDRAGISIISSSNYNVISGNTVVSGSSVAVGGAIHLSGVSYNTITGNATHDSANEIYVYNSSHITITGNSAYSGWREGIDINRSSFVTITGNTVKSNTRDGIRIYESSKVVVDSNIIEDNGTGGTKYDGIHISNWSDSRYSDKNIVSNNSVYANGGAGKYQINIEGTSAAHFNNNQITDNLVDVGATGAGTINDSGTDTQISGNYTGTAGEGLFHTEANSSSTALTVVQSGGGDIVNFFDGDTEVFTILDGGEVGIGTADPKQKLHVAGRLATDDKISEGLVGNWHFDEATSGNAHGETLTDDSGYGNDGTGAGTDGPTWTTGKFGGALDFETDNDQYVEISPIIELADDNSWSVVLYVKLESSGDRGFCGNTDTVGNYSKIYFWSNAWLDIRVVNNTDEYAGWHLDFENWIGTWAHLAFICDGSDSSNIEFFIDGTSKGKQTLADSALTIKRIASMGSTTFSCFDGLIDEPRIYKRALTADEIQQQYNAGIWKYGTGGIAYMDGNVGIGTTSPDNLLSLNEASGDVLMDFDLNDADKWVMGIDDSDNDYFKINSGNTLADVSNFTFEDNGNLRITGALTVGAASTTYGDNSIESGSTLSVNTTGNQAVSFGTGAFSATATTDINLATANATAADIDIGTSSQANTISIGTATASSTLELASADWGISTTGVISNISGFTQNEGAFSHTGSTNSLNLTGAISWDTDSTMTVGAQTYSLTTDGGALSLTSAGALTASYSGGQIIGTGTNAITLGNSGDTLALASSGWAISTTGDMTGIGSIDQGLIAWWPLDDDALDKSGKSNDGGAFVDCGSTVTDVDGNTYNIVRIGTQCWMKENLNVGAMIASPATMPTDNGGTIEKWCNGADGDGHTTSGDCDIYGGLYSWDEAMGYPSGGNTGEICPTGWHIPTDTEYKTLEVYLGMCEGVGGSPYCVDADNQWRGTNEGSELADDADKWSAGNLENDADFGKSDFDALPAGHRGTNNTFYYRTRYTTFWSSTEGITGAWIRRLGYTRTGVGRSDYYKANGFSVRCLKD